MSYRQIKQDFFNWIKELGKPELADCAWAFIGDVALEIGGEQKSRELLAARFSAQNLDRAWEFVQAYREGMKNESELQEAIAKAHYDSAMENYPIDGDEAVSDLDSYAVVYSDRVEVTAHVRGLGDKLPRQGRKYIGNRDNICWQFPLSSLQQVSRVVDIVFDEKGDKMEISKKPSTFFPR